MYRNKKKITMTEFVKKTGYTIELFCDIMTLAVDFLDIVSNTLKKCDGVGLEAFEDEECDVGILFHTYDDKRLKIGYANYLHVGEDYDILDSGCIYFLDSDFIYQRYLYFYSLKDRKSKGVIDKNHNLILDKTDYYAYLLDIGVIESFGECDSEPLQEFSFTENDESCYKNCFCISSSIIDFDISKMKIH